MSKDRAKLLDDLLNGRCSESQSDLNSLPWDWEGAPLAVLTSDHINGQLNNFMTGSISSAQVGDWANSIEGREDIEYDPESEIGRVLNLLANPEINDSLTHQVAVQLVARLSGNAT
jgi:hypothetical protein